MRKELETVCEQEVQVCGWFSGYKRVGRWSLLDRFQNKFRGASIIVFAERMVTTKHDWMRSHSARPRDVPNFFLAWQWIWASGTNSDFKSGMYRRKKNRVACWWHFPFSGKAPFCSFCGVAWKAYKKFHTIKAKIWHCSTTFPTLTRSCFHLRKHICKISPVSCSPLPGSS